jgi:hypothetical protein
VDIGEYVGDYSSIALDANNAPHISYSDGAKTNLKYARRLEGKWLTETVDGAAQHVGTYSAPALDAEGTAHISSHNSTSGDLKYARRSIP